MDDEPVLTQLMTRAADQGGDWKVPSSLGLVVLRRRRRRRTGLGVVAAVCSVAVVATIALAVTHRNHDRDSATPPAPAASSPATAATPVTPTVTATDLVGATWSSLPTAPIAGRSGAASVWTGSQLVIWGGEMTASSKNQLVADGAVYDPASKTWRVMPTSPLSARAQSASVWTGQAMFIWGGHVDTTPDQASDGALYHPTTRRWQSLPTLTIATYTWSEAFWTGQVVILLTSRTDNNSNTIETHSYDPATNAWTARPTLHAANGHDLGQQSGVLGDNRLFVWLLWSHTTKINANSSSTRSGIDGYTFDLATSQWHANSLRPLTGGIEMPLWTGRDIVLPAAPFWCGFCSQPMSTNRSGTLLDPDTSTPRVIPHGPADDLNPQYIWTGGALLAVNTDVETIGGGKGDKPGEAAVWDPITGDWTRLASASTAVVDPVITWTGASVLIWGGDGSKTVGLQFGP